MRIIKQHFPIKEAMQVLPNVIKKIRDNNTMKCSHSSMGW